MTFRQNNFIQLGSTYTGYTQSNCNTNYISCNTTIHSIDNTRSVNVADFETYFKLPQNLNLTELKEQISRKRIFEQYLYIIDKLHYRKITRNLPIDSWIPLNRDVLRKYLSKDFLHIILKELKQLGIIECNESYSTIKHQSKKYRLTPTYRTHQTLDYKMTDKKLIKKILRKQETLINSHPVYANMYRWLGELEISDVAKDHIQPYQYDKEMYSHLVDSIDRIKRKRIYLVQGDKSNRIYTPISNLKSELRQFLSINGQPLAQVDIRNSQPLFFCLTLKDNDYINQEELSKITQLALNGDFYSFFSPSSQSYDEQKVGVFTNILFGTVEALKRSEQGRILQTHFPSIYAHLLASKHKNYKTLSIDMQNIEAKFIYSVCSDLYKHTQYQMPFLTIHDSIVCYESYVETLQDAIDYYFFQMFGVRPPTKIEYFKVNQ